MLKIRKLEIDIDTIGNKKFGANYTFNTNRLNIIKGSNHSGKTTIVSAIFYALGMEELLGGRNTKALDSILTSVVPYERNEYQINEASISLELENKNKEIITIKRYSKHVDISPKIAFIYESKIDDITLNTENKTTYIHDKGSAKNTLGFYKFLEGYLNYQLPMVPSYTEGEEVKLYLQVIFNAFFVEQLKGWTDFFATIPNFGIKEPKKRIIEFLMNLDAREFEKSKFEYEQKKERLIKKWLLHIESLSQSVEQISANIEIEYSEPVSVDKFRDSKLNIYFSNDNDIENEDAKINLLDYINNKKDELVRIEAEIDKPKSKSDEKLFNIRKKVKKIARKISKLNEIISFKSSELISSKQQLQKLSAEISNLTDLQKVRNLLNNNTYTHNLTKNICPTCQQKISSSFHTNIDVMGVDENKAYLKEQEQILKVYIKALEHEIEQQKEVKNFLQNEYTETQKIIQYLEKDIVSNLNLSSYKKTIDIKSEIELLERVENYKNKIKAELLILSEEWKRNEMNRSTYEMSVEDSQKITQLETYFKNYLQTFNYGSKDDEQIFISKKQFERYFPIVRIDGKDEKIRINSSASDFVRSLWAYYISLFKTSKDYDGKHIGLMIYDEPAQHAMNESDQKAFLESLALLDGCQSIVFSSFEDKDNSPVGQEKFKNMISDIDESNIHVIEIKEHSIEIIN